MQKTFSWKNRLKDIRFWIVVFFLVRMYGIANPPLEVLHNWRQTTVTMAARNFGEVDANILYPRVDFAGELTGITGMEFPLLNYLIYLISAIFGYDHWYGRLINLLVTSAGIWYFFRLVRLRFGERMAFTSSFLLMTSLWFVYARQIMPDTFSMSLVIIGFYHGYRFLTEEGKPIRLLYYFLFILPGILSKLPSAYILILFVPLMFDPEIPLRKKVWFSLVSALALAPICWWYFYWVPMLVERYGFWHFFMGKSISEGWKEILENVNETLNKFYDIALKFIGFGAFLAGLFFAFHRRNKALLWIFFLSAAAFSVIVLKGGYTFTHHSYYVIPFVPVMALVAGYALEQIPNRKIVVFLLIVISVENIGTQQHNFRIHEENEKLLTLESVLDRYTKKKDLVLINSGEVPTPMYFAHRKGWIAYNAQIAAPGYIDSLRQKGLKHVVILKRTFGEMLALDYPAVYDSPDFRVYSLQ